MVHISSTLYFLDWCSYRTLPSISHRCENLVGIELVINEIWYSSENLNCEMWIDLCDTSVWQRKIWVTDRKYQTHDLPNTRHGRHSMIVTGIHHIAYNRISTVKVIVCGDKWIKLVFCVHNWRLKRLGH